MVWVCVGLGALSVAPVVWLEGLLQNIPIVGNSWLVAYASATLKTAIPEECVKVSIIAAVALRAREFDEPMDGVVYGTAVGLGFAAVENLLFLVGVGMNWEAVAIKRAILSVPFHGALGAIAGALIAMARFGGALGAHRSDHSHRSRLFAFAFLVPITLHTLSDAPVLWMEKASADTANTTEGFVKIWALTISILAVGFGTIGFAVRLAQKIAHRQKAWLRSKHLPLDHWRAVWAQSVISVGLIFIAVTLIPAGMMASDWVAHIAGWALLIIGFIMCWRSGRFLNQAAKRPNHSAAASPSS